MRGASARADALLDRRLLSEVTEHLNRVDLRDQNLMGVIEPLRALLRAETMISYGYRFDAKRLELVSAEAASRCTSARSIVNVFHQWRANDDDPWVCFNVLRPERWQRNRSLQTSEIYRAYPERSARFNEEFLPKLGMRGFDQLRVIVFDQGSAVGWIGGLRPQPFRKREVRLLNSLVPSFRRRLRWRKLLEQEVSVDGVLEAIASATFVVRRNGELVHGNSAGMALWNADRRGTAEALRQALRGGATGNEFEVAPIVDSGAGQLFLATRRRLPDLSSRLQFASRRWGLTPRQTEVLTRVAGGTSNLGIALDLGCSVKTVETHIAALFDKVQVPSRSALVGKVLGESA